jgi:hypothetical protein
MAHEGGRLDRRRVSGVTHRRSRSSLPVGSWPMAARSWITSLTTDFHRGDARDRHLFRRS